ncbi:HpcH/HpaI aldolase/citrate lyase family protein [Desulfosporosinus nitroreducens]|uniref:HpcH/HpaI aldolase/citrate lyase family protein n=1 Tax=Desulfosporosinus nitroreducens TaxID=2018668 RepID=A0ABT8QTW3_9FIRM|nr:HpcH/HpaI aldolase/citrate lyase family protein [Desulfosporosinus nitroreducens]MDO0824282.1 HpcH/HpaI aldolase/citrate lyase family protein [Desulfosporosinus nitroreducens]
MRHHLYNPGFDFVIEPESFDKYTDRDLLQYCLGATMYMPGTNDFTTKILSAAMPGLTTIVLCFEDACPEEDVPAAEENVHRLLETVCNAVKEGRLAKQKVPLIFCRIRNMKQFEHFAENLTSEQVKVLAGINFPKFNAENGEAYFAYLKKLNVKFGEILYGMPIIEETEVAFKETRMQELLGIKEIIDHYHELVLQVRVGATDFSSCFGVRRGVDYSIYDILTVRECLCDILNVFSRNNEYVVSGPVWEYFRASKQMMFLDLPKHDLEDCLMKRIPIVNLEIDGLLRELILDKANGFVGRTVIHPTHVKFVNALQAVTKEEYDDACQILRNKSGGVVKGASENKMNEVKPHTNWANKVYMRAKAYGVIQNESAFIELFAVDD